MTRADVARLHLSMRDKPTQANRTLEVISKMFNLAEEWGYRPEGTNPRKRISECPETEAENGFSVRPSSSRSARCSPKWRPSALQLPSAIAAIRLLMLSGCRLNEIMSLQWRYVRLGSGELRFLTPETGKKTVQLGAAAVQVLQRVPRIDGNPWVIGGKNEGEHLTDLQPFWQRIRARAGLNDVRIHDLRHTFASVAAEKACPSP